MSNQYDETYKNTKFQEEFLRKEKLRAYACIYF